MDPEAEIAAKTRSRTKKKTPLIATFQKNNSDKTETGTVASYGSTRYTSHRQEPDKGVTPLPPPLVGHQLNNSVCFEYEVIQCTTLLRMSDDSELSGWLANLFE